MKTEERTFVAIKPDGVKRGFIGKIIERFENKGFKIVAMKLLQVTPELASKHYAEHQGKPFYNRLVHYITSGPIVAMVIEGYEAIQSVRHIVGATDPQKADVGTIRADFAQNIILYTLLIHRKALQEKSDYISNRKKFMITGSLCWR